MRVSARDPEALKRSRAAVSDHMAWLVRRRLSPETVRARRQRLENVDQFAARCALTLLELGPAELDEWQAEVVQRQLAVVTERAYVSHVQMFYKWAWENELLSMNPAIKLIKPRIPRRTPRPIPEEKLALAYEQADPHMRAIICLAAMAGLRAIEIARLAWEDIDLHGLMYVVGKGGHDRSIRLADSPALVEALDALPNRRGPVIPRLDGKPGHNQANTLDARANTYLHDLGIEETLHQLRHRFATVAYRASQDPIAVQRLLGHSSLTTTSIYAAASEESTSTAMGAASLFGPPPVGPAQRRLHVVRTASE